MDEFLSSAAINPNLVGPTLPPVPPFTLPTGSTGPTGDAGPTGNTIHSPLHIDAPHRFLNDHYKKAGVPRIRIHDLRHTHATLMLQAEEQPKIVQDRLGHSSIQMPLDKYSHITQNMLQQAE